MLAHGDGRDRVGRRNTSVGVLALAVLFLFGAASPLIAQSSTRAVLAGRVFDVDHNPLPGVTITVHSPSGAGRGRRLVSF